MFPHKYFATAIIDLFFRDLARFHRRYYGLNVADERAGLQQHVGAGFQSGHTIVGFVGGFRSFHRQSVGEHYTVEFHAFFEQTCGNGGRQ
jgi:hypothetical protein